jgi:predicted RNA-binding Zn ribbon-like protein
MSDRTSELTHHWEAPGELERVRALLNTSPDVVRRPSRDLLDDEGQHELLDWIRAKSGEELDAIRTLRQDLRAAVADGRVTDINRWLDCDQPRIAVASNAVPRLDFRASEGPNRVLACVLLSIVDETWTRMRICPECGLAFFDASRARTKKWCGMYAGADGRACGSVAKMRRFRSKSRPRKRDTGGR